MKRRSIAERRRAVRAGRLAEWLAAWMFRLQGFRVLGRNVRTPAGEIDLVVRRGKLVVFVEVKRRPDGGAALIALSREQQRRIGRAAQYLQLSGRLGPGVETFRFDLVAISPRHLPRHLPDAWQP